MMKSLVCEAGAITEQTLPSHFAGTDFWIRAWRTEENREKLPAVSYMQKGFQGQDNSKETRALEDSLQDAIWETKFKRNNYW